MSDRPVVLFLCTGNSCRSQMAEALLRARAGGRLEARSAGTEPKAAIHPLAYRVMAEIGLDMAGQHPKDLNVYLGHLPVRHLVIVCSSANASCPSVWPGVMTRAFWPIEDPAEARGTEAEQLAKFRQARDEIAARIAGWLAQPAPA